MTVVSVVVLTRGDRPAELDAAVRSVRAQAGVEVEVVVVWNGVAAALPSPGDVDVVLDENVGIPAGRNVGARRAGSDLIVFLDDDAAFVGTDGIARVAARLGDPAVGVVAMRIVDDEGTSAPRHVPRVLGRGADRSGPVAGFLGGACAVRRSDFEAVGGYAEAFFYAMEETDLALAIVDRGRSIWYDADVEVRHPRTEPSRHPDALERTARNRVWLAHRRLPAAIALAYLTSWWVITTVRIPSTAVRTLRAYRQAWPTRPGPRRPIAWRTVWRLTRLGRPPIV